MILKSNEDFLVLRKTPSIGKIQFENFEFSRKKHCYCLTSSLYNDFLEYWLQFGHVFLFSSIYPLAAFLALVHNMVDLKVNCYKLCRVMRKPTPRAIRDIGAWYSAFTITSVISIMTNLALLSMDKDVQAFAPNASSRDWVLLFVAIEHIFLLIRVIIDKIIPDVPSKTKFKIDMNDFKLKSK